MRGASIGGECEEQAQDVPDWEGTLEGDCEEQEQDVPDWEGTLEGVG